jgi:NAD+ kinase
MALSFISYFRDALGSALAKRLEDEYRGVPVPDGEAIVAVGGDGMVLTALPQAKGRVVYGIKPPASNSVAYTLNDFVEGQDLNEAIEQAPKYDIHPIQIDVEYEDGSHQHFDAYNSFNLVRSTAQAMKVRLTGVFNDVSRTMDLMGDGLVFSTPLGSTGMNASYSGPIVPLDKNAMILIGQGIGSPMAFKNPIISGPGDTYEIDCITSRGKRPLRIDIDSNSITADANNAFKRITVQLAPQPAARLAIQPGRLHPFRRFELPS